MVGVAQHGGGFFCDAQIAGTLTSGSAPARRARHGGHLTSHCRGKECGWSGLKHRAGTLSHPSGAHR